MSSWKTLATILNQYCGQSLNLSWLLTLQSIYLSKLSLSYPVSPFKSSSSLLVSSASWWSRMSLVVHNGSSTSSCFFVRPSFSLGFGTSWSLIWDSFQIPTGKRIIYNTFIMAMHNSLLILLQPRKQITSLMNEKYIKINTTKILHNSISYYRQHKHC